MNRSVREPYAEWCESLIPSVIADGTGYSMCAVRAVIKMEEGPPVRSFRRAHQTTLMMHLR